MSNQQKREVSRDEFIVLRKMESLAQQNANQSVRIAELETQISLLQLEIENLTKQAEMTANQSAELTAVDQDGEVVEVEAEEAISH